MDHKHEADRVKDGKDNEKDAGLSHHWGCSVIYKPGVLTTKFNQRSWQKATGVKLRMNSILVRSSYRSRLVPRPPTRGESGWDRG